MSPSPTISQTAIAAFPVAYQPAAENAARSLRPYFDASYRWQSVEAWVLGTTVQIPRRLHFAELEQARIDARDRHWLVIQCLRSRSTDGHERHSGLRAIVNSNEAAIIPFVVLLAGEYVVEIIDDIVDALPTLDREAYANFVRENRPVMRSLRAKAISYWDCYYRADYPDRSHYPGLAFLHEIERWAA